MKKNTALTIINGVGLLVIGMAVFYTKQTNALLGIVLLVFLDLILGFELD